MDKTMYYKGYKLRRGMNGSVCIKEFYASRGTLTCADLQDAKNQIDRVTKEKEDKMLTFDNIAYTTGCVTVTTPYLEPCNVVQPADCVPAPANKPNKKGKQMSRYYDEYNDCYVDQPQSDTADARSYFKSRIGSVYSAKRYELMKQFGLVDDAAPETMEDLVKRIQDGKYVIPKEYAEKTLYDPARYIQWRDPSMKKDQAGFDAAWNVFDKEADKARDAVMSQPFDKVAEAVQALEAWTTK